MSSLKKDQLEEFRTSLWQSFFDPKLVSMTLFLDSAMPLSADALDELVTILADYDGKEPEDFAKVPGSLADAIEDGIVRVSSAELRDLKAQKHQLVFEQLKRLGAKDARLDAPMIHFAILVIWGVSMDASTCDPYAE